MLFITQGKTNWKFLLIVVILAIVAGGGIFFLSRTLKIVIDIPTIPQTICTKDSDCRSSCGCGCINKNKFCPGDELKECDGYPCQCSNNKCIKKDENTQKEIFQEDISRCVSFSNFSYQLYIGFNHSVSPTEAQNILKAVDAYDIVSKSDNTTYYFHIPDGKICDGIIQLRKSDRVVIVDSVPWMPTAP